MLTFAVWLLHLGCTNVESSDSFKYQQYTTQELFQAAKVGVTEADLRSYRVALLRKSEIPAERDTLLQILSMLESQNPTNHYYQWVVESLRCAVYIESGEITRGLDLANRARRFLETHDSIIPADIYHNIGFAYMNLGGADDSVLYYWRKAYQLTEESQDIKRLTVTSFNLAAHYHNLGLYELARKLFSRTIQAMEQLGKKSPLLMNNIVSTMIARERYQEAETYWQEHASDLVGDTSTYAGQVILLNRAVLSQRIGRFEETDSILKVFRFVSIQPLLSRDYVQALCLQAYRWNSDSLADRRFEKQLVPNLDFLIHNEGPMMQDWMLRPAWKYLKDSVPALYQRLKNQVGYSPRYLAALSQYLATNATSISESNKYFREMLDFQKKVKEAQLKTDLLATNELSEYESVMSQLAFNKIALEASKRREVNYIVIIVLVVLLVVLSYISLKEKLSISKERTAWLEKEKLQAEEIVLSNQRLITYSKVVLERNNQIKQRLSRLKLKGNSALVLEVKEVIKELDTLNRVSTEEKPQIADDLIEKQPKEEHPHLAVLTKVEQRVYVLVQSNYRPKDIANMLGYSVQYVRNIKTRIRKKLQLDESWDA